MKKKISSIFFYIILSLVLSSCNNFKGYTIDGKVDNGEGVKVYLEDISEIAPLVIDTATVLKSSFQLKNYSKKGIYRLRFGEDSKNSIFLYLEEKDKLKIKADLNAIEDYSITGSKGSASIKLLSAETKVYFANLDASFTKVKNADASTKDSLQQIFDGLKKNYIKYIKDFVENEPVNDVACFGLNYLGSMMQEEIPYLVAVTDKLHTAYPDARYVNTWFKQTQQYRDAILSETDGGVALNTKAPNIILQNPNGDTIQLYSLAGNYVLVDFWASWCQPCRMENPNVVALYNKYHTQGFDIFSVSLDANSDQWKKAIKKDGLVWKNHGCDFGGWQSAPAQLYKVQSIPCTYLLDKTGMVIAKNLRGDELAAKLKELFSQSIN